VLAAAYGVPCAVSDELVMVALKLRAGTRFDPQAFFAFCDQLVTRGGMDRKWFPDFVRIVGELEYTQTEKILVRNLKQAHFHPARVGGDALYWRRRGDTAFQPFTTEAFATLRTSFAAAEKIDLLER
jgi:fatty-acyl-CoA synthase